MKQSALRLKHPGPIVSAIRDDPKREAVDMVNSISSKLGLVGRRDFITGNPQIAEPIQDSLIRGASSGKPQIPVISPE